MIPKLNISQSRTFASDEFPSRNQKFHTPLFVENSPFRKLVVLLDVNVLSDLDHEKEEKINLLAGLINLDTIICFHYADEGPPVDFTWRQHPKFGEVAPNWALIEKNIESGERAVITYRNETLACHRIAGNTEEVAAIDMSTEAYRLLSPEEAIQRRKSDALAAKVAECIKADIFISDRTYLRMLQRDIVDGVTVVGVDDAIAIIGLYLRAQRKYISYRSAIDNSEYRLDRGTYFWIGTLELLPSIWRYETALSKNPSTSSDERAIFLWRSALQRLQKALEFRDDVYKGLNRATDLDAIESTITSFEAVALFLMGSIDALARITNLVLEIDSEPRNVGWQKSKWLKGLQDKAPDLHKHFENNAAGWHTIAILGAIRNSIHGIALLPFAETNLEIPNAFIIGLPEANARKLEKAFSFLGGSEIWGVKELMAGQLLFDPGILLEKLFEHVITTISRILVETPFESFPPISIKPLELYIPEFSRDNACHVSYRQNIRWLLGF